MGSNPNVSQGLLTSVEIQGMRAGQNKKSSKISKSKQDEEDDKFFEEKDSLYYSRDNDCESFENELNGHAENFSDGESRYSQQLKG